MHTLVCFNDDEQEQQRIQFHTYATLLAVSAFFLGLTFLVYIFLPKLLNLHGKTVVCHVISLFLGYTFLSIVQFATEVRLPFCLCIGEFSS
jgi:Na+-driven multidrug efflux pump